MTENEPVLSSSEDRRTGGGPVEPQDLRSAFENAPIGIAVVRPNGVITGCNGALERLLGHPASVLIGGTFFDVTFEADLPLAVESCRLMQEGATAVLRHECRFVHRDGNVMWVSVSTSRVPDAPDRPAHLIMHVEDIGARKALEAELQRQALHDPLTGLANRKLLLDRAAHALARTSRQGGRVSLLFLDLNGFKQVNDEHGHDVGDRVLVELSRRMRESLRPGDTAARLGGDEFVVLCEDADPAYADVVGLRLRQLAATPFEVGEAVIRLSAAVGISGPAPGPEGRVDPAGLLHAADLDMYRVKRAARNGAAERKDVDAGSAEA